MQFSLRNLRATLAVLATLAILAGFPSRPAQAQAAVLMEQPYGFFGLMNPTGHNAVYFARICAETPFVLRRCHAGELGSVIARYQGMNHRDWAAIPLIPYLYAVDSLSDVPTQVSAQIVQKMRSDYRFTRATYLDAQIRPGNIIRGGWKHLYGVLYDRRVYAYRFETTEAEDDALIAKLNTEPNVSHFNLFYMNCADFVRLVLNHYFPGNFNRRLIPDAGVGTPRQNSSRLLRFAKKHPERKLTVFEIPQIPGFRRPSRLNKGISQSLVTTSYLVPLYFMHPYIPAAIAVHYLLNCRFSLHRTKPERVTPDRLLAFTELPAPAQPAEPAPTQTNALAATP